MPDTPRRRRPAASCRGRPTSQRTLSGSPGRVGRDTTSASRTWAEPLTRRVPGPGRDIDHASTSGAGLNPLAAGGCRLLAAISDPKMDDRRGKKPRRGSHLIPQRSPRYQGTLALLGRTSLTCSRLLRAHGLLEKIPRNSTGGYQIPAEARIKILDSARRSQRKPR